MVVGRINGVVALTGCFYKKMYERFAGPKRSGRNNEVVVRRGSTVLVTMDVTSLYTNIPEEHGMQIYARHTTSFTKATLISQPDSF